MFSKVSPKTAAMYVIRLFMNFLLIAECVGVDIFYYDYTDRVNEIIDLCSAYVALDFALSLMLCVGLHFTPSTWKLDLPMLLTLALFCLSLISRTEWSMSGIYFALNAINITLMLTPIMTLMERFAVKVITNHISMSKVRHHRP